MIFYTAEDIESLAAQGQKELVLDADTALTDLARDTARQLGIALVYAARPAPTSANPASPAVRQPQSSPAQLGLKPKGCQHGPLNTANPPDQTNNANASNPLVDRLVGMVKQIGNRPRNGQSA